MRICLGYKKGTKMKKYIVLASAFTVMLVHVATAQQSVADPKLETYKLLLNEANARLAESNAIVSNLQQQLETAKSELAKLKLEKEPKK